MKNDPSKSLIVTVVVCAFTVAATFRTPALRAAQTGAGESDLQAGVQVVGISPTQPSKGPYVKTGRGYMVPYGTTIPGTRVSFDMVPVPGGTFRMRVQNGALKPDRDSEVEVTVGPFWIGRYEVTWAEYDPYCELLDPFARFEYLGIRKVTSDNRCDAVTAPSVIYDPQMYFPATADKEEWPGTPRGR